MDTPEKPIRPWWMRKRWWAVLLTLVPPLTYVASYAVSEHYGPYNLSDLGHHRIFPFAAVARAYAPLAEIEASLTGRVIALESRDRCLAYVAYPGD